VSSADRPPPLSTLRHCSFSSPPPGRPLPAPSSSTASSRSSRAARDRVPSSLRVGLLVFFPPDQWLPRFGKSNMTLIAVATFFPFMKFLFVAPYCKRRKHRPREPNRRLLISGHWSRQRVRFSPLVAPASAHPALPSQCPLAILVLEIYTGEFPPFLPRELALPHKFECLLLRFFPPPHYGPSPRSFGMRFGRVFVPPTQGSFPPRESSPPDWSRFFPLRLRKIDVFFLMDLPPDNAVFPDPPPFSRGRGTLYSWSLLINGQRSLLPQNPRFPPYNSSSFEGFLFILPGVVSRDGDVGVSPL